MNQQMGALLPLSASLPSMSLSLRAVNILLDKKEMAALRVANLIYESSSKLILEFRSITVSTFMINHYGGKKIKLELKNV